MLLDVDRRRTKKQKKSHLNAIFNLKVTLRVTRTLNYILETDLERLQLAILPFGKVCQKVLRPSRYLRVCESDTGRQDLA